MKPKIGIVICGFKEHGQFVTDSYVTAIHRSGGLACLLPYVPSKSSIREYISLMDGFLFCGGDDITPLLFGEEPKELTKNTNIALDLYQIHLMKEAVCAQKPILAICRGMQILNVALGGTLYQDISSLPDTINHMQESQDRWDVSHRVTFCKGSRLSRILETSVYTNSFHHQAVKKAGKGLLVSGSSGDGITEAIELASHPFALGVQWHPESMLLKNDTMKPLFLHFIFACTRKENRS